MINLPEWRLTNPFPAFYDSESGSAIEQTAKVYKAMQELIKEYNTFSEGVTKAINDHDNEIAEKLELFELEFSQKFQDFIDTVELEIEHASEEEIAKITAKFTELQTELETAIANIQTIPGKSAYEVAKDNGFEGSESEWLESLKGDDGNYTMPTFTLATTSEMNNKLLTEIFPTLRVGTRRIKMIFTDDISSTMGIKITPPSTTGYSGEITLKEVELDVSLGKGFITSSMYDVCFELHFFGGIYKAEINYNTSTNKPSGTTFPNGAWSFTKVTSLS